MTFTEDELSEIESTVGTLCARRTVPKFKSELSIEYRIKAHDVTIVEKRPKWNGAPGFTESGIARFKFNRARKRGALSSRFRPRPADPP